MPEQATEVFKVFAAIKDRRYDTVFLYYNDAESYYADGGFRGSLRVELSTSSVKSGVTNEDEKVRQL